MLLWQIIGGPQKIDSRCDLRPPRYERTLPQPNSPCNHATERIAGNALVDRTMQLAHAQQYVARLRTGQAREMMQCHVYFSFRWRWQSA